MSGQSPPREHDQLGWLMGEVDRLRDKVDRLRAELEQARSTCPHSNCDAQRWRDALERIAAADAGAGEYPSEVARDALAGDQ